MKKRKKRRSQCAYCPNPATTEDHVPPKSLFASDDRQNVIKVPCCVRCHIKTSRDDEYFRDALNMNARVFDHPDVQKNSSSLRRSFSNSHNQKLKSQLLGSIRLVNPRTQGGLLLPLQPVFTVHIRRLDNVIARITKGLFFHEKGYRLPDDHMAMGFTTAEFERAPQHFLQYVRENLIEKVLTRKPTTIGNDVFSYKFMCDSDYPNSSAWLFLFYGELSFIGITLPRVDALDIEKAILSPWSV